MTQSNDFKASNEPGVPMRWAAKRIASAIILVALILSGLGYGIYSILNNSSSPAVSKPQSSSKVAASKPKPTTNNPPSSSVSSAASGSTAVVPAATASGQLTNTGPGDVAIIGFMGVSLIASLAHYGWAKLMLRRRAQA